MRMLVLFRGAPGCGKSTFIDNYGLRNYALSADELRLMHGSPELTIHGSEQISCMFDKDVWSTLFKILEQRMKNGEFTVIDATNSKTSEMNRYKDLAKKYRYRIFVVDMTGLPIEECKRRNSQRIPMRRVPDEVIDKMYARFATQKIPSGIVKCNRDDLFDKIAYKEIDLNSYKRIHIIGDIHGCNTCLQEYLNKDGGLLDTDMYIFCGDYIDRGIENAEVLNFLFSIMDKENVCLLEGNHERSLYYYGHNEPSPSREFNFNTSRQLNDAGIDRKQCKILYSRLRQCAYFVFDGFTYLVTHGGLPSIGKYGILKYISTRQMIHGAGQYEDADAVMKSWSENTPSSYRQVFGHRNVQKNPIDAGHRCYMLEGHIEFGGCLRAIELTHGEEVATFEIKNNVFRKREPKTVDTSGVSGSANQAGQDVPQNDVAKIVEAMRASKDVKEKRFNNISSFNFTRNVFTRKSWNGLNCKARGLFIDTQENKIVARSYDKFFNVNEREETELNNMSINMKFPVRAYIKYNGFLGMLSYDKAADDFLFATKSCIGGPYSEIFKRVFEECLNPDCREPLFSYLKNNNVTLVFEVIDPEADPHIIKYQKPECILLDVVYNEPEFRCYDDPKREQFSKEFGLATKECVDSFTSWQHFYKWYKMVTSDDFTFGGHYIEGFVVEDSSGFKVKIKTEYYKKWKFLRGVAQSVSKYGYIQHTEALNDKLKNEFYGWLREKREEAVAAGGTLDTNIISLRDQFFEDKHKKLIANIKNDITLRLSELDELAEQQEAGNNDE